MKTSFLLLLTLPLFAQGQSHPVITYQDGLDNCRRIKEEKAKSTTAVSGITGPECMCMIGATFPEFSYTTLEGKQFTTDNLKGKITILNFWMISCPPCIAEIPGLNNIVQKYGQDDFNYIAFGLDDEKDIRNFLEKHPWRFDQLSSGNTIILDDLKMFWGFPTTFVLDQDGVIIDAFSGGSADKGAEKEIEDKLSSTVDKALRY